MYLYRHIRLDNNEPFYIGIGSDNTYFRANQKTNRNKYWNKVVSKTDYEVEIMLEGLTKEEAYNKEIFFIKYYGRKKEGGPLVNICIGGQLGKKGLKDTLETRKKKSKSAKQPKTEAWKISQSKSRKGKKRGVLPWLINNKIRNKKISEAKKGKPSFKKTPILQFDKNYNLIKEHTSITEAQLYIKCKGIGNVLTNRAKSCGGYYWKYKNK